MERGGKKSGRLTMAKLLGHCILTGYLMIVEAWWMLRVTNKKWRYENNAVEEGKLGTGVSQKMKERDKRRICM